MALSNPKYARPGGLGGFSSAGADASATVPLLRVPENPAATEAGAQMADSTYTNDPAGAVSARFSETYGGSGSPRAVSPLLPQSALPSPLSSDDIARIYKPLLQQIDADKKIPNQPLPPPTPALATFLSVLAGSLGAQLTKDPRVEESVIRNLQDNVVRRQAIEDQNYANDLMFNREKANRRLAATGQMLEGELRNALDNQDSKRAMVIQGNLEKIRGYYQGRTEEIQGQNQQAIAKIAADVKAETKPGETLEPKDYATRRGELITSKNIPEDKRGGFLWLTVNHPKAQEIAQLDKEALHSGNPATVNAAKRNIQQSVLKSLGLKMQENYDRTQSVAIQKMLEKMYGLSIDEAF